MNQSDINNTKKPKAPVLVVIISWFLLLAGIIGLLVAGPFLLIAGFGESMLLVVVGVLTLLRNVVLIVLSFGLRQMRRWSLYVFTALTGITVLTSLYSFFVEAGAQPIDLIDPGINVLVLVYFWYISKKFVN